jgi:hypothetical protein
MRLTLRDGCWGGWGPRTSSCGMGGCGSGRYAGSGYVERREGHGSLLSKAIATHGESLSERSRDAACLGRRDGVGEGQPPSSTREPLNAHNYIDYVLGESRPRKASRGYDSTQESKDDVLFSQSSPQEA